MNDNATLESNRELVEEAANDAGARLIAFDDENHWLVFYPVSNQENGLTAVKVYWDEMSVYISDATTDWQEVQLFPGNEREAYTMLLRVMSQPRQFLKKPQPAKPKADKQTLTRMWHVNQHRRKQRYLRIGWLCAVLGVALTLLNVVVIGCWLKGLQLPPSFVFSLSGPAYFLVGALQYFALKRAKKLPPFDELGEKP